MPSQSKARLGAGTAAILAGATLASGAHAQMAMRSAGAQLDTGGPRLAMQVDSGVVYDSNIARGDAAVAQIRGLEKSDSAYRAEAIGDYHGPLGPLRFQIRAASGYEWHPRNPVLDSDRISTDGVLGLALARCNLALSGGLTRRQSSLEDVGLTVTRNRQSDANAAVDTNCIVGSHLSVSLGLAYAATNNSAKTGVVDSRTHDVNLSIGYMSRAIGTLSLFGQYERLDYNDQTPGLTFVTPTSDLYNFGLRLERPILARLRGSAAVSYISVRPHGALSGDYGGLSSDVALTYLATPRISTTLQYSREISATLQEGASYTLSERVQFDGQWAVSPRSSLSLGAFWRSRDYRGVFDQGLFFFPQSDRVKSVFGTAEYKMGRRISWKLDAAYEQRTAALSLFNYTSYRVGLSLTAKLK